MSESERHSSYQPEAGQTVLHCAHAREEVDDIGPAGSGVQRSFKVGTHWFKVTSPYEAPNGDKGIASWLVACHPCWLGTGCNLDQLKKIEIGGHLVWDGNAPVIVMEDLA